MEDVLVATFVLSFITGLIGMVFDLFAMDEWELSDAVVPVVVFPLLTTAVVAGVVWIARLIVLG